FAGGVRRGAEAEHREDDEDDRDPSPERAHDQGHEDEHAPEPDERHDRGDLGSVTSLGALLGGLALDGRAAVAALVGAPDEPVAALRAFHELPPTASSRRGVRRATLARDEKARAGRASTGAGSSASGGGVGDRDQTAASFRRANPARPRRPMPK